MSGYDYDVHFDCLIKGANFKLSIDYHILCEQNSVLDILITESGLDNRKININLHLFNGGGGILNEEIELYDLYH